MKRAWRALAAWSAMGYVWAGTPLLADPPAAVVVEVEQYHGLTRVDNFNPPVQPRAKARPAIQPETVIVVSAPVSGSMQTLVPASEITVSDNFQAGVAKDGANAGQAAFVRPRYQKPYTPSEPTGASKYEVQSNLPKPTAESAQESRPKQAQAEPSYVIVNQPREVHQEGNLTALSALLGTILTPLAVLAGIWIVVRYLQGRSGPLIRIEHIGGVYAASVAPSEHAVVPKPYIVEMPAEPPVEETSTAHHFELGPTFEEDRLTREQQAQQQEEGLLRQLFDDNIKLQKQLKETHEDWLRQAGAEAKVTTPEDGLREAAAETEATTSAESQEVVTASDTLASI